ncbi:MAG: SpoIIE family protein phosphatase [Actinomycetota bacterium]|nr:SpoIIE family protein phosphatase [Actinomycetota bacterium]
MAVRLRGANGPDEDQSFEEVGRLADLPARLRRYNGTLDALVIGSRLEDAIDMASRAHARDPDLSVVILLEAGHEEAIRPNGQRGPLPPSHVAFRTPSEDAELSEAVRSAVEATRDRRRRPPQPAEALAPRVRAEIELERTRLEALFHHAPMPAGWLWGPDHVVEYANPMALELFGGSHRQLLGTKPRDSVPEVSTQGYFELLDYVFESGDPFLGRELPVRLNRDGEGLYEGYYTFIFQATKDPVGKVNGILLLGVEVTEQAVARDRIKELGDAAASERDRLAQVLEAIPEGILLAEADWHVGMANRAAEEILGDVVEDLRDYDGYGLRRPDGSAYGPGELPLARAIRRGEVVRGEQLVIRNMRTGREVPTLVNSAPLRNKSGQITGGVAAFQDISRLKEIEERLRRAVEEKDESLVARDQALMEAEAARYRLQFLLEASTVMGASLEFPEALDRLARLATSSLADLCLIDIVEESGQVVRMATVHADPARQHLADQLKDRYAPDPAGPHPAVRVMETGEAMISPEMPEEFLRATTRDEDHFRLVTELGFQSYMCVPLRARGHTIGTITLVSTRADRRYGPSDLALARDLAWRAAMAVDNARLYSERSHVARTLQASLLPRDLPAIPGAEISARYHAAGEGNEVGGDFYDLYETDDGSWAIVIGDVCGKGAEAAAVTGQARYTLRAASMQQRRPSRILETLNEAMLAQRSDLRFCTVTFVRFRLTDYGARATVACGGHPAPLVLRVDGSIESVGKPGTLLGIFPDPDISDRATDLGPGDSLILYTDGVIGARAHGDIFTEERLGEVLAEAAGASAAEVAARIEQSVLEFQAGDLRDDVAILVVRLAG